MTLEQLAMPKRVYDRAYASVRFRADKLDPLKVAPDFDLAAFWQQSTITFKSTLPKYVAKFRVSPDVFPQLSFAGRFARVGTYWRPTRTDGSS